MMDDHDPVETQEWVDSIKAVLHYSGPERVRHLLGKAAGEAALGGAPFFATNTPYLNTIPPSNRPIPGATRRSSPHPRAIRWNAMAIGPAREQGRPPSSAATSRASSPRRLLYEIGFNHFWRAPTDGARRRPRLHPGPLSPASTPARSSRAGSPRSRCDKFRRRSAAAGCRSYPHPWLMPDFWQFPTVSMGLGPLMAIYQARFMKYLQDRGLAETAERKVWAFLGDGEWTSPSRWARSRSPAARSSTT